MPLGFKAGRVQGGGQTRPDSKEKTSWRSRQALRQDSDGAKEEKGISANHKQA